jgi:membrane dipeptidase
MTKMTRRSLLSGASTAGLAMGLRLGLRANTSSAAEAPASRIVVEGLDDSLLNEPFLDLLRKGGVHCVHKTMDGIAEAGEDTCFGAVYDFADRYSDKMVIATSLQDIRQARKDGKIAFVLIWQDSNILDRLIRENANSPVYSPMTNGIRGYYQLGLRVMGVCYNSANLFGGGCVDPSEPLTHAGRCLVEEIHKHNIILDIGGHTGERTSLDAIEMSTGIPVVCSHTNMAALNPNMRCISDRLAVAIAATGGLIGLTAVNDFHVRNPNVAGVVRSPQATLDMHLDQYDYLRKLVGIDHVALAPDFSWGASEGAAPGEDAVNWPRGARSAGELLYVKGFENASMLPNLVGGLQRRGWRESELDKLLGANWLRVYERVWRA